MINIIICPAAALKQWIFSENDFTQISDGIFHNDGFCVKLKFKWRGGKSVNKEVHQTNPETAGAIAGEALPEIYTRRQAELARLERLEKIQQERDSIKDLKQLAEFETKQCENLIKESKNILSKNLAAGVRTEWASLYNDEPFPPFVFKNPAPRLNQVARETGVPTKSFFSELLSPAAKKERLQKESDAQNAYALQMKHYEEEKESQRIAHEKERDAYIAVQSEYNSNVEQLQLDYEKGRPAAIQSFARIVLNRITMPDLITVYFDALCQPDEKLLVIDCVLPPYYDLPRSVSYQYNKEIGEIAPTIMDEQEFAVYYLDLIQQIALTAMYKIFDEIPARHVQCVGFNGLVENSEIGDTLISKSCIITCMAARDTFAALDISKKTPAECFLSLKGVLAKSLSGADSVPSIIIAGPLADTDEANQAPGDSQSLPKPPEYQPGEFKQVTTKIVDEMLEEIEKKLLGSTQDKDDIVH
jgi:hypothetical protein